MTTDHIAILSPDLFIHNDGINFVRSSPSGCNLAAMTWLVRVNDERRQGRVDCLDLAARTIAQALPNYRLWLLAGHHAWRPDTKRFRIFKLWRSMTNLGLKIPATLHGPEVIVEKSGEFKWIAVAAISRDELALVDDIVSAEQTSFLLAAPHSPSIDEYLAAGWADGSPWTMAYWRDLSLVAARSESLLFRQFGRFDDVEVGVNVIGAPETIAMLEGTDSTRQLV